MADRRSVALVPLLVLAMLLWGGTWPAGKLLAVTAPSELLVFWRFLVTAPAMAPVLFLLRRGRSAPVLGLSARSWAFAVGAAAAIILYNVLFFAGLRLGLASIGGVAAPTLSALLTWLATLALERRRPMPLAVVGAVLGLAGGVLILRAWRLDLADLARSGNLFFIGAAAAWAVVTLLSQRAQEQGGFAPVSFVIYTSAAVLAAPLSVARGGLTPPATPAFWLQVLYLGVLSTAFATTVFFLAASRLGSSRASSFMFVVPIAAMQSSWLLLGERPDGVMLAGAALSVAAVYLLNTRRPRAAPSAQTGPRPPSPQDRANHGTFPRKRLLSEVGRDPTTRP